ncbi:MAG: DUF4345 domain-containing protein [Cytophagales bacterium]|nr:DUF4345 domain-containing protein [Cytophagales bacterium]
MEIISTVTLSLSGLLLTMVGTLRLTNPIKNYAKNSGIQLAQDTDLLNEVRGVSAVMLFAGTILLSGAFVSAITTSALMIAALIFLGFAVGRILSISIDGKPNKQLITGLVTELILGTANVICLLLNFG